MTISVRKNFVFDESVVKQLELLAQAKQKSQTAVIQELIVDSAREIEKKKKLEAFHSLVGSLNGQLQRKTIQSIKGEQDV